FREQNDRFEIHAYDEDMRLRWERVLDFEKRTASIIAIVPGDTSFHVVYGYRDHGDYFVKHHHYDPNTDLLDTVTVAVVEKSYFSPKFKHAVSEDKTKLLLFRSDKESELFAMGYDLVQGKELWVRDLHFDNGLFRRDFRAMEVSDAGDMYVVMDHEKVSRRNQEFEVYILNGSTESLITKNVNLDEIVALDLYVKFDNINDQLVLAGLINEKNVDRAKGIFMATLGMRGIDPGIRTIYFNEDLLQEVHGKDVSLRKGLSNYSVQDIALRQDGGALIITEMNKEYSRRPNVPIRRDGAYGRTGWVDYYYEDLLIFSVHPDGSEHWRTVLHKKQYSQDDEGVYSSYFLFKTPELLRLIFNDEIKQENTISEYVLRGNGYVKRNNVFNTDYQRLRLRFRDAVQVAYNECIVPSERNNR
ncbi:MAG: hypothetical protein R3330_16090, partial [Saprospiraceae bacterium]|nr:hypothetical protein [Saprospiraceae bacterium]